MKAYKKCYICSLTILCLSCSSQQVLENETHQRAGIIVKNVCKIEGVKPVRGIIYKYDERFPWLELKYYSIRDNVSINFTLESNLSGDDEIKQLATQDANRWCQLNAQYSINGVKYEVEVNGSRSPVFECIEDDNPRGKFYFTSVHVPNLQARLVAAVSTINDSLTPTSLEMSDLEVKSAIEDLINSDRWRNKVRRAN